MSSKELAKQRERYWKADPRCHYCGVETILKPAHIKKMELTAEERDRLATIDHLRPRHHPDRLKLPKPGERLHVLACSKCNNERDRQELLAKPKEWFEQNGGSKPLHKRTVEEIEAILAKIEYEPPRSPSRIVGKQRYSFNKRKNNQIALVWAWFEKGIDT
jgi:hypothetical protein